MNNRNSVLRGLVLLMVVFSASILLRGVDAAGPEFGITVQSPDRDAYLLGETIHWSGSIEFDGDSSGVGVTLVIDGPQPVTEVLPVSPGTYSFPASNLVVVVTVDLQTTSTGSTLPGGTLPGSTLPGSTLPGSVVTATSIDYDFEWTPPVLLDPPPAFTLVPDMAVAFPIALVTPAAGPDSGLVSLPATTEMFTVPVVGTPGVGEPQALPDGDLAFVVPIVPTPTPEAGAADPLPSVSALYTIPEVPTAVPVEGAPDDLPAITVAFDVPLAPTPTPVAGAPADLDTLTVAFDVPLAATPTSVAGAPADLDTLTVAFDVPAATTPTPETGAATALDVSLTTAFAIPAAPTPTPVAGVDDLDAVAGGTAVTVAFAVPGSGEPLGITTDGTDFFVLVNDSPDKIYKVTSAGAVITAWGTSGIVEVTRNSEAVDKAQGIALVKGYLYVSDNQWRDEEGDGYSLLKFAATTGAEADIGTTEGENSCAIPDYQEIFGLTADGSKLWGSTRWGDLRKFSTKCSAATDFWTELNSMPGAVLGSGDNEFFFGVSEGTIYKFLEGESSAAASWEIDDSLDIQGITYSGGVLYFAEAENSKIYKSAIPHGQTVTTNPLGLTFDGTYLYTLVDASPFDKVIVTATSSATIINSFDMPTGSVDAIAYNSTDQFLYIGQKVGSWDRKICKIHRGTGKVIGSCSDLTEPINSELGGMGYDGTDLVGFRKSDTNDFYTITASSGASERIDVEGSDGNENGYTAGTYRTANDRAYGANNNYIYEFNVDGTQRQAITLGGSIDIQGMTFVDANLYFADDGNNTIYYGSIPHGVTVSQDPLAVASYSTSTLYILTDGTPFDKILTVDATTGVASAQFDAPDGSGQGLTYLGGYLYYASNAGDRRIYKLNATTGAQEANFQPKRTDGQEMNENLLGLGNDGSDLWLSYADTWNACIYKINETNGNNKGQFCQNENWENALKQTTGIAIAPDGSILIAKDDEIVKRDSAGEYLQEWTGLDGTDIQGLAFIDTVLYVADSGNNKIYKTSLPHGVTTSQDPLALASYGTSSLYILTDGTPYDKILIVDAATGVASAEFDAPDASGQGLTYLGGYLYYATNASDRRIYKLNATTGAEVDDFRPQSTHGELHENLLGLGNDGSDLWLSYSDNNQACIYKINKANGDNKGQFCQNENWDNALKAAKGIAIAPDGSILIAKDDEVVKRDSGGEYSQDWTGLDGTDIQGLAFIDTVLYVADSGNNKIYKTSLPHGVTTSQDPLALASYGTSTLYILTDGTPFDQILIVDAATGVASSVFDAPDASGQGLTYLDGYLYYASNAGEARIYKLNATTGAQEDDFRPMGDGGEINNTLIGLGNDGDDLIVSTDRDDPWNQCLFLVNSSNGGEQGRFCSGEQTSLAYARGVTLASDEFVLIAQDDEVVQLGPDGQEVTRWSNLVGSTDITGLTFMNDTLYIADDDNDKIYKAAVPSGLVVTTDPLALAYGMADSATTLFVLVDGSPVDKVLLIDPADGSYRSSWDAPDDEGGGLTYFGTSLYYASNADGVRRIYELNPNTGGQLSNFRPAHPYGGDINMNFTSLSNDGTNLLLAVDDFNDACLYVVNASNGDSDGRFCPPSSPGNQWGPGQSEGLTGAAGLAVTADGDVIEAEGQKFVQITADETFTINYDTSLVDVRGIVFVGSNLYVADDDGTGTIYKTTVPTGIDISTDPRALAYRASGVTSTIFVLVDATPKDKVLLVNLASGTLVGSYDGPDMNGQGLTYMDGSLYYAGRDESNRAIIYRLEPDTGVVQDTVSLRDQWGEVYDEIRSLGNDGENLLTYLGNDTCLKKFDPNTGDGVGEYCPDLGQALNGPGGVAVATDGTLFTAKSDEIAQAMLTDQNQTLEVNRWTLTSGGDVEGLVFVGDVLYFADDDTDAVYKASKPTGITDDPLGLAYDGTNLYILVEGALVDHIVVVNPTTGVVVADFEAPDRETNGITFLVSNSVPTLFVSVVSQSDHQGRQHYVHMISPNDGSELAQRVQVHDEGWVDGWHGLTNDGEYVILAPSQDAPILYLNPDSGNIEDRVWFYNGQFNGFQAISYHDSRDDFLATNGNEVLQVDGDGRYLQSFGTSLGQLNGAVVIGDTLYLADSQNNSIHAANIPVPPTTESTSPKGMATDGTDLYLVVDGNPKDRILVLSTETGEVLNSYEAPDDNVDGLAWHNGDLYAVANGYHPDMGDLPPRIYKMASSTGAILSDFEIQSPWGGTINDTIASLASDGTYLYAGEEGQPCWFILDPASPGSPAQQTCGNGNFMWPYYVGSLEIIAAEGIPTTLLSSGQGDGGQVLTRHDLNGQTEEQFFMARDIKGMAYIGSTLYLADSNNEEILTATMHNNIPEVTSVGDYEAGIRVVSGQVTEVSDSAATFSLARNVVMRTVITSPLENFATTTTVIPIQGRVSDPSVRNVTVGVLLPFTTLLEDDVTTGASPAKWDAEGLWNVDCSAYWGTPIYDSEPCAWRYGQTDQPGYGSGVVSQGSLTLKEAIDIGPGSVLRFGTWYATEPAPDTDLKLVEVAVVTTDEDGNDVVGDYEALAQILDYGFMGSDVPVDEQNVPLFTTHSTFEHREVEQAAFEFDEGKGEHSSRFEIIDINLSDFVGDTILIRFRFDTVDDFANDDLGWFIDDIVIEGSGFKGQQTPVIPLDTPQTVNGVTWYGRFDTTFELAQGQNRVVAAAEQPYPPKPHDDNLFGIHFLTGYLDLIGPALTLGGIEEVVAARTQVLNGSVADINFTSLVITQTYMSGSEELQKTVFALDPAKFEQLPTDGSFSKQINLYEGTNTFLATALDGSLNQSQKTVVVELDTQGPTLNPLSPSYPLGAVSARPGDQVVFQANSNDAQGVQRVFLTLPDGSTKNMVPSDRIPEAVLDQWKVTGGYVLPMKIPAGSTLDLSLNITSVDNAGNTASGVVQAVVKPSLEAFTFNLLPGQNLISMPLQPTTSTIADLLGPDLLAAIDTIMYYDATLTNLPQEDRWLMYSPDAPNNVQTLLELQPGRGFWFKMKEEAFSYSAPLAEGLPSTPRPILFTFSGLFLEPGTVPPSYPVVPGWNLIGFHSEHVLPVTTALQSLESPQRVWASLYQYENVIKFELDEDPEIFLGGFSRVLADDSMEPGKGYWTFIVEEGVIVP